MASSKSQVNLQSKWPVRSSQRADQVRAGGGEHIVDSVGGSDDAFASSLGRVSREPADDVASLLVVESLVVHSLRQ